MESKPPEEPHPDEPGDGQPPAETEIESDPEIAEPLPGEEDESKPPEEPHPDEPGDGQPPAETEIESDPEIAEPLPGEEDA